MMSMSKAAPPRVTSEETEEVKESKIVDDEESKLLDDNLNEKVNSENKQVPNYTVGTR